MFDAVTTMKDFWSALRLQHAAGGVRGGARLILAVFIKVFQKPYTRVGTGRKSCPCCGWKGTNFLPYIDEGYVSFQTECPVCRSQARHRAHYLFYQKTFHSICGELLYISPERNIEYFRKMDCLKVRTSEYQPEAPADFHYDLIDMNCPDASWNYIICHRVIEHVPDDRRAMRELYRVLRPGGICVLSVPIEMGLARTIEYHKPNPLESNHFYRYGIDFVSRIPEQFAVEVYDFRTFFSEEEFDQLHLHGDHIYVCKKSE